MEYFTVLMLTSSCSKQPKLSNTNINEASERSLLTDDCNLVTCLISDTVVT